MNLDKDELTIFGMICAWAITLATFSWKGSRIVSRVEVLESDTRDMKQSIKEVKKEVDTLSHNLIVFSKELHGMRDLLGVKLDNINKTLELSKSEFNGHQDRTTKTLESFVLMHTQAVEKIDNLTQKVYQSR